MTQAQEVAKHPSVIWADVAKVKNFGQALETLKITHFCVRTSMTQRRRPKLQEENNFSMILSAVRGPPHSLKMLQEFSTEIKPFFAASRQF